MSKATSHAEQCAGRPPQGHCSAAEWAAFVHGQPGSPTEQQAEGTATPPGLPWLPEPRWQAVLSAAGALPALAQLPDSLLEKSEAWREVYTAAEPHRSPLPGVWCLLTDVQRLIVLRALRQALVYEYWACGPIFSACQRQSDAELTGVPRLIVLQNTYQAGEHALICDG